MSDFTLADKQQLLGTLKARVEADLATLQHAHEETTQGVTHEDARQEGDKDMRSTEASYIARGQARRVTELQNALGALEALKLRAFAADTPVALGALVTVELDDSALHLFMAPAAGGMRVEFGSATVRVITPRSPLGQAVLGRSQGDEVLWETPQGDAEGIIAAVI